MADDQAQAGEGSLDLLPGARLVEPAHDMTGLAKINPVWVTSGYWGPLSEEQHPAIVTLRGVFPDEIEGVVFFRDEVTIQVKSRRLVEMCTLLRDHPDLSYRMLSDLTAVDMLRLRTAPRFDVVATLYSVKNRQRLRLKTSIDEQQACPSLTPVWTGANWLERECYDMFGIHFDGHPDLRRILMPEMFTDFPMRKDFPMQGKMTDQEWAEWIISRAQRTEGEDA
jgi:NADH-quinone oxidoreductase subunit C